MIEAHDGKLTNSDINNPLGRQRIADPVEALLDQLETLSGDTVAGAKFTPDPIEHRIRMLFAKCSHHLRAVQLELAQATDAAQVMNERAERLFAEASATVSEVKKRLSAAQSVRRNSESKATELLARANNGSRDVLESALELADSYVGQHEISVDAVDRWVFEKAGDAAAAMINGLETRIVEIGSVNDEATPLTDADSLNAA